MNPNKIIKLFLLASIVFNICYSQDVSLTKTGNLYKNLMDNNLYIYELRDDECKFLFEPTILYTVCQGGIYIYDIENFEESDQLLLLGELQFTDPDFNFNSQLQALQNQVLYIKFDQESNMVRQYDVSDPQNITEMSFIQFLYPVVQIQIVEELNYFIAELVETQQDGENTIKFYHAYIYQINGSDLQFLDKQQYDTTFYIFIENTNMRMITGKEMLIYDLTDPNNLFNCIFSIEYLDFIWDFVFPENFYYYEKDSIIVLQYSIGLRLINIYDGENPVVQQEIRLSEDKRSNAIYTTENLFHEHFIYIKTKFSFSGELDSFGIISLKDLKDVSVNYQNELQSNKLLRIALIPQSPFVMIQISSDQNLVTFQKVLFDCQEEPDQRIQKISSYSNPYTALLINSNLDHNGKNLYLCDPFGFFGLEVLSMEVPAAPESSYITNGVGPWGAYMAAKYMAVFQTKDDRYLFAVAKYSISIYFMVIDLSTENRDSIDIELSGLNDYIVQSYYLSLDENLAIIALDAQDSLFFIDVSDKMNPTILENISISAEHLISNFHILKNEKYLLLNDRNIPDLTSNFIIYDIQDLQNISEFTTFTEDILEDGEINHGNASRQQLYVEETGILYVLLGNGISVWDLNDLNNIRKITWVQDQNIPFDDKATQVQIQPNLSKLYVAYTDANRISIFDVRNPLSVPIFKKNFEVIEAMQIKIQFSPRYENHLYLVGTNKVQLIEINDENVAYIPSEEYKLGEESEMNIYPLRVINPITFQCTIPKITNFNIVNIDSYVLEDDLTWTISQLPYFYEKYYLDSRIIAKPQTFKDIGEQIIHLKISYQIPIDIFVGLTLNSEEIDEVLSKDIIFNLISIGYLDIQRYLTNQFDPSQEIWMDSQFTEIEKTIRGMLSGYIADVSTQIEIQESLDLNQTNQSIVLNTPTTQQINCQVTLVSPLGGDGEVGYIFMSNANYPNIITAYSEDLQSVMLSGLQEDLNHTFNLIKITSVSGDNTDDSRRSLEEIQQVNAVLEINDGLNTKQEITIENFQNFVYINTSPSLNEENLQIQFDTQVKNPQIEQELFFVPNLNHFIDIDNDSLEFIIEFKVSYINSEDEQNQTSNVPQHEFEWHILENSWLTFNKNTFQFKGSPDPVYIDMIFNVRIAATDGYKLSDYDQFQINLYDQPPQLFQNLQSQLDDKEVVITEKFELRIQAYDEDSPELFYSIGNIYKDGNLEPVQDLWLQIDKMGVLSGTPPNTVLSVEYRIYVQISDGYKQIKDHITFTVQNTLWNKVKQVLEVLAIVISVLGIIKYRDEIYNVLFKKYYQFPKDLIQSGQLYKKQIPLINQLAIDSKEIYKLLKQQSLKKDKSKKKWYDIYINNEQKFELTLFTQTLSKTYLQYLEKKMQGSKVSKITESEQEQIKQLSLDMQLIINKEDHQIVNKSGTLNAFSYMQSGQDVDTKLSQYYNYTSPGKTYINGFKKTLAERIIKSQKARESKMNNHLVLNHDISPFILTYVGYHIVRELTQNDISQYILDDMQLNIQDQLKYRGKSGWISELFDQEGQFNLNEEKFDRQFNISFRNIQDLPVFDKKNKDKKSKQHIMEIVKTIIIAEAHGILKPSGLIGKLFMKLKPSRGLCIDTSYTNVKNVKSITFNEDSFLVKYCRSLAAYLNLGQSAFPTPNQMPLWLNQDIDLVNNMIVLYGTPTEEDIDNEYLIRATNVHNYFIRQYVIKVIPGEGNQDSNFTNHKFQEQSIKIPDAGQSQFITVIQNKIEQYGGTSTRRKLTEDVAFKAGQTEQYETQRKKSDECLKSPKTAVTEQFDMNRNQAVSKISKFTYPENEDQIDPAKENQQEESASMVSSFIANENIGPKSIDQSYADLHGIRSTNMLSQRIYDTKEIPTMPRGFSKSEGKAIISNNL